MTLTDEQWTEQLQASEDPDSLYPDAPKYDLPEGAQTDYEVADDDQYDDYDGDAGDGEPFGDYADPDQDGDPGAPQDLVEVPLDSGEHDEPAPRGVHHHTEDPHRPDSRLEWNRHRGVLPRPARCALRNR